MAPFSRLQLQRARGALAAAARLPASSQRLQVRLPHKPAAAALTAAQASARTEKRCAGAWHTRFSVLLRWVFWLAQRGCCKDIPASMSWRKCAPRCALPLVEWHQRGAVRPGEANWPQTSATHLHALCFLGSVAAFGVSLMTLMPFFQLQRETGRRRCRAPRCAPSARRAPRPRGAARPAPPPWPAWPGLLSRAHARSAQPSRTASA